MLFKLSNLNSNLALTLGYLNPALNNSALNSSRSLLLWSSGLLFCKTSGPFSAPVTTRRRYRGQFRVHQGSSHPTVFATILVYFSSSRFWTARSAHSRRSQLVCRCLKPLAHLLLPSQDSRTFYRARDQLFLLTATQRLHLFFMLIDTLLSLVPFF